MNAKLMGLVAVGSLMLGAAGVNAADLVTYSFQGAKAGASGDPSAGAVDTQPANGSASAVTVTGLTATTTIGADRFAVTGAAAGALDAGKYWQFTITPNSGYEVNLTGIRFLTDRNGSGFESVTVRTSIDTYTANKAAFTRPTADTTADVSHPSQALARDFLICRPLRFACTHMVLKPVAALA